MSYEQPLKAAVELGAEFSIRDDRVTITARAPLPDDLILTLRGMREDIVELWNERAAIREFDGGLQRTEAESLASMDLVDVDSCCRS